MKILAVEKENANTTAEQFKPFLKNEASVVWDLYKKRIIREIYFTQDTHEAVIIMECVNAKEAENILNELPLVKENLISFDIKPLTAYDGFERLFGQ